MIVNNFGEKAPCSREILGRALLGANRLSLSKKTGALKLILQTAYFLLAEATICVLLTIRRRPYRLAVRTLPFHGRCTGSIPVRVAIKIKGFPSKLSFLGMLHSGWWSINNPWANIFQGAHLSIEA